MASVRQATMTDADALGETHVAAWRAAYRHVLDQRFLADLDPAERARWWRRRLATDDGLEVFVVVEGGAVQGSVLFGPPEAEENITDLTPLVGQIHALNLRPAAWGRGLGDQLLAAAEERLRQRGSRRAFLWVIADNPRARRLYERRGWVEQGEVRRERIGPGHVEEIRYALDLDG